MLQKLKENSFDHLFNLDKLGTNEEKIIKKENKEKKYQYKGTTIRHALLGRENLWVPHTKPEPKAAQCQRSSLHCMYGKALLT